MKKMLTPRVAKWFDEVNMDQSLLSGLLEAIMDLDESFGRKLRLCVWVTFGLKPWVAWYIT